MGMKGAPLRAVVCLSIVSLFLIIPAQAAGTTELTIKRLANDDVTVLNQTTVNYTWMMTNLPVLGDGVTHYYHQGPVFVDDPDPVIEEQLRWNPKEDTNVLEKDMGAVKGTNLKDLCDLVGGMSVGEEVKILASDGWNMLFNYTNVYQYSSREGPMGICWYQDGMYPDTGYTDGMRLIWFADDSVNTLGPNRTGVHAFGNWDWHEAAAPEYWYYYQSGSERYPTTTGLSGKKINRIYIYSNDHPPSVYTKTLVAGWNLISLSLTATDMTRNTVIDESLFGMYDALYKYDAATHSFMLLDSPDDVMVNGVGYFINITQSGGAVWEYVGVPYTTMNVDLSEGLNMIGSLNCSKVISEGLYSIDGNYYYLAWWNATEQSFEVYNPNAPSAFNDFTTMDCGEGYFLSMKSVDTLQETC